MYYCLLRQSDATQRTDIRKKQYIINKISRNAKCVTVFYLSQMMYKNKNVGVYLILSIADKRMWGRDICVRKNIN